MKPKIEKTEKSKIDWMITLVPLTLVLGLSVLFFFMPDQSSAVVSQIRYFMGDTMGSYYLIIGLVIFFVSLYLAFSKYGNIVLGRQDEKPKYSFFAWGSMMFTAGLAADILFYSFSEWAYYAESARVAELGGEGAAAIQEWAPVFPLFHWSIIPWGFYLVLAAAFGFMLHVRNREKQKFSEACRPILGKHTDGILGRFIDLLAVFALIAGTATTFSLATPLMASAFNSLFGVQFDTTVVTVAMLLITCAIYTYSLLHGIKGMSFLANSCIYLFFALAIFTLLFGGEAKYIIETGLSSVGTMIQNFFGLATYTDPNRTSNFPQDYTIYYWAYWMVWCVASPFFIGTISRGRTIKQTILGGYLFGAGSTLVSFMILGNYSLGRQMSGKSDFLKTFNGEGIYDMIIEIIETLPAAPVILALVIITMLLLYATSFDAIALVASRYSYKKLKKGEEPSKWIQLMWCILLIVLPIALLFAGSSRSNIESVSIVSAFPLALVLVLITISFLKDAKKFSREQTGEIQSESAEETEKTEE